MTETLNVDLDAVRALGAQCAQHAASVDELAPSESVRGADTSMPGSAVGQAAAAVGDPLGRAFSARAKALATFATNVSASAAGYEKTDEAIGWALTEITGGHR